MTENNEGRIPAAPVYDCFHGDKVKEPCRIIRKVRMLFLTGGKWTARGINQRCDTNDARKCISVLRKVYKMRICSRWTDDGWKEYWLESEPAPSLFPEEAVLLQ